MKPALKITEYAYHKLQYFRKKSKGDEISLFGISSKDDHLLVEDLYMPEQTSSGSGTEPTEEGIAEYFRHCEEEYDNPDRWARIWIHTHPSGVHNPSGTDETTWDEIFGCAPWAIMFILANDDKYFCKLKQRFSEVVTEDEDGKKKREYTHIEQEIDFVVEQDNRWTQYHEQWDKEFNVVEKRNKWQNNWQYGNWNGNFTEGKMGYMAEDTEPKDAGQKDGFGDKVSVLPDFDKFYRSADNIFEVVHEHTVATGEAVNEVYHQYFMDTLDCEMTVRQFVGKFFANSPELGQLIVEWLDAEPCKKHSIEDLTDMLEEFEGHLDSFWLEVSQDKEVTDEL